MKSVSHTKSFEMARPAAELFPLFSPEGEKLWVPGWDYEKVTEGAELREDYIFLTSAHDHAATGAIWIVKRYDPLSYFVQFYKIEPGDKVGVVTVKCSEMAPSRSRVEVTYTYTVLSASGEQFLSAFDDAAYEAFIDEWQQLLTRYFESKE